MNHPNPICPVTLFEHADEERSDRFFEATFLEFVGFLSNGAGERFGTEVEPWLFAPCEFRNGIRSADHVVRSGLVMLVVHRGLELNVAVELLSGNRLAGFIHTTAQHSEARPAFCVGIPLSQTVDAVTYTPTWQAMNRLFDSASDWTRAGAHSLFRVPACIGGREARVFVQSGEIHTAEDWIEEVARLEHGMAGTV